MSTEKKKIPKKAVKPTAAQKQLRVHEVQDMLLAGLKKSEIVRNCTVVLEWNVNLRCIESYMAEATDLIAGELDKIRPDLVSKLYSQYQFIYRRMVNNKDYRGATMVLDRMCQFVNINKHELPPDEGSGMPALSISFETVTRKRNENIQEAEIVPEGEIGVKRISS